MVDIADIVIRVDSTQVTAASGNLANLQKNTVGLLSSLSRAGAATLQYKKEVALLEQANRQNILTNSDLARSLVQLESRYNAMGLAVDSAGNMMESSQAQANNFGYRVQQVGYQVGDFFVQIQSGTNFMVAFGQQATQLAGLIPGVLGAALGIGISLFTAIGATLMRSSEGAGTFQDAMDKVNDVLSDTEGILKVVNGDFEELREKFGSLSPAIMALVDTRADIALRNIADAAKGLRNELTEMYNGNVWLNISRAEDLGAAFGFGTQNTRELASAMENLKNQDTLQGQVEAATRLRELFLSMAGPVQQMTSDELAFYLALVDAEEATRELHRRTVEVQTTTGGLLDLMNLFVDAAGTAANAVSNIGTQASGAIGAVEELGRAMWNAAQTRLEALRYIESNSPGGAGYLANQYSMYGAGRVAFDRAARQEDSLFGTPETPSGRDGGGRRSAQLKKEIELVKELTDAEKERQGILNSVQSSLESGFMAMVTGTESVKDAFKKMAFSIIQELYKVLVVQRMVGSFDIATGKGSGIVGVLGGLFGARASGGTMMANRPYLVGEHGPELVIPRHSGTVVNANQTSDAMVSGGGFTQNLSINVSGSDAAMVRTEIAKMIPQITNATKAAVIDAKQRGGQMAAAFR